MVVTITIKSYSNNTSGGVTVRIPQLSTSQISNDILLFEILMKPNTDPIINIDIATKDQKFVGSTILKNLSNEKGDFPVSVNVPIKTNGIDAKVEFTLTAKVVFDKVTEFKPLDLKSQKIKLQNLLAFLSDNKPVIYEPNEVYIKKMCNYLGVDVNKILSILHLL